MLPLAIGCDDAAVEFKNTLVQWLNDIHVKLIDYSIDKNRDSNLYPDIAWAVCQAIKEGKHTRGILICGTGIGMAITANKVPGIRAAQCHDTYSAERARKSNNAQVITLGARVIGPELAKNIIQSWLNSEYEGGRSIPKVERISYYEQKKDHKNIL